MAEGLHYLSGDLDRILGFLRHDSAYAPALRVILNNQVIPPAQPFVEAFLGGDDVTWDQPPLSEQPWEVYASITGFFAQALRLLCADVGIDTWSNGARLRWLTADWRPLRQDLGWMIASRPLGRVRFLRHDPPIAAALAYLESWPHGWLRRDEYQRFRPLVHQLIAELARAAELDLRADDVASRDDDLRFELNNAATTDDTWAWQLQRALALADAIDVALERERDLICVGF